MKIILAANFISFISNMIMVYNGQVKNKSSMLKWSILQLTLLAISSLMLGGYIGVILSLFGIVRNILVIKDKFNNAYRIIISLILLVISGYPILINHEWFGIPVLLSSLVLNLYIDVRNLMVFKCINLASLICWLVYDICLYNIAGAIFDISGMASYTIWIIRNRKGMENK